MTRTKFDQIQLVENTRLIIWDLDETFWDGTLTEGGIRYREDHHAFVIELAKRGIMSTICSKNNANEIEAVLKERELWDYFIFPSIDWTPKGPRIAAMLAQIGLRASSVLFLDDNPMNLAQASHHNPGLNVGLPSLIPKLVNAPQLRGKPDVHLTRLAQYKVKERKAKAAEVACGDTIAFLRTSNVRVFVEYNVEAHLDRAIELINRTNQLNFTKKRLPEDQVAARKELTALLAQNTTDAALIRVCDNFGDYGFVGFYLTERLHNVRRLRHFCFSCRTLNMYIEHWTYAHLGRPPLEVVGDVLSDIQNETTRVDWVTPVVALTELEDTSPTTTVRYDNIIARGGCDLASLMHYFVLHTNNLVEEFNQPKNGQMLRQDHTSFLMPALGAGLCGEQCDAAATLGYVPEDFHSQLGTFPKGRSLCFLSFWADADIPEYRHKRTGLTVPYWLIGAQNHDLIAQEELRETVTQNDVQRQRLATLVRDFDHIGLLSSERMAQRYRQILDHIPTSVVVIVVLAPIRGPLHFENPDKPPHPHHQRLNEAVSRAVQGRDNVMLLDPADFIERSEDMIDLNHFTRPVYHRMYVEVIERLSRTDKGAAYV
ncbi:HAD-IIIC family phosphatase [Sulfitobacter sp. F26204]|uniref:HAD-IIIC family phosphatase n=1 Tax=Sulfitobacter sp. F26204 TaxID=2996014 RepID=UPI00225E4012|nr:HAD-IIIC family phosphatase [Sulfitobacter sp. F26204]MCX7558204.1 HAD-IIIC family phosphatase [Sulfitobacter sp. F26204]